jgi:hypothetical protein
MPDAKLTDVSRMSMSAGNPTLMTSLISATKRGAIVLRRHPTLIGFPDSDVR